MSFSFFCISSSFTIIILLRILLCGLFLFIIVCSLVEKNSFYFKWDNTSSHVNLNSNYSIYFSTGGDLYSKEQYDRYARCLKLLSWLHFRSFIFWLIYLFIHWLINLFTHFLIELFMDSFSAFIHLIIYSQKIIKIIFQSSRSIRQWSEDCSRVMGESGYSARE